METAEVIDMTRFEGVTLAGRYRLEQYLDQGNFGAVYRATQEAFGIPLRDVAIKIAKRPMSETEARQAFQEALLMARVSDGAGDSGLRQHFVAIYDAGRCPEGGELGGHPFVVMELVPGSLKKALRATGRFPLTRAVAYFDQILRAMAFMHDKRLIHRDLKPGNVLVSRRADGTDVLKVSDFGLVVAVGELLGWAQSGGDLAYLAPESFSHDRCSPRSDVYMLGLVFHEMLTGRNPFAEVGSHLSGKTPENHEEIRRLHLEARHHLDLRPISGHEELKLRPALAEVICTSLRFGEQDRIYSSAAQMLQAWEDAKGRLIGSEERSEQKWETVRRMVREGEQFLKVGNQDTYRAMLEAAMAINRDPRQVPDSMMVARAYLLDVEWLLAHARAEEAGQIAKEAYRRRRRCRESCMAMAKFFGHSKSPLANSFHAEANGYAPEEA
jgi:serine/threonine protein kinase